MKKKKNAKVKFVGNGNQSEEKIDAEPQSLKARLSCDGPDKISSKYVAKASRVRHTIIILLLNHINYSNVPFYHRETIVRVLKKNLKKDRFNCSVIPKNHIRLEIY